MDPIIQILLGAAVTLAIGLFWRKIDGLDVRITKSDEANASNLARINLLDRDLGRHDERGLNLQRTMDAIFESLREIKNKLDSKADKE